MRVTDDAGNSRIAYRHVRINPLTYSALARPKDAGGSVAATVASDAGTPRAVMEPPAQHSIVWGIVSVVCLAVAMASVGLGTHLARLRVLGLRPLAVGLLASLTVGGVSAVLLMSLGPWLSSLV